LNPFQLGLRVGVIIVSPYTRAGYVSHVTHDSGSVLHFAETALDLPSLGQEDSRADDFTDVFDFTQAPRSFTPFAIHHSIEEVRRAATEGRQAQPGTRANDD
jgi:phospholipase C